MNKVLIVGGLIGLLGEQRIDGLQAEADEKADLLAVQLEEVQEDVKGKIEARLKQMQRAYHARSAKRGQAWALTKEALAM
jgi:hypothetical protein